MTKKDYVLIAKALQLRTVYDAEDMTYAEGWHAGVSSCIDALADVLQRDNPKFDRARFLAACGVQS